MAREGYGQCPRARCASTCGAAPERPNAARRRYRVARGPLRRPRPRGGAFMSPTRLSALDASFLTVETPTAHMHVGWAAVFDPPEDGPRPTFAELRDHIASRLDRAPRYRQRLESVPFGVNEPVWVDDDDFDVRHHVLEADSDNLDEVVSAAMSTPLEHSRPMWECW